MKARPVSEQGRDAPDGVSSATETRSAKPWTASAWIFIVPLLLAGGCAAWVGPDAGVWLTWVGVLLLLGVAALPLASTVFKAVPSVAYGFAILFGLALVAMVAWQLASLHVVPFGVVSCWLATAVLAAACWIPRPGRRAVANAVSARGTTYGWATLASVFVLVGGVWTHVRGTMPQLDGLEKFMDLGLMNSIWRTEWLPAQDTWLAGQSVNYYYYGQFVYTVVCKLTGIPPVIGYNLAMASTFAVLVVGVAGLLVFLLSRAGASPIWRVVGAAVGAIATSIAGNSHAFFYAGPGMAVLDAFRSLGIDVGQTDSFFFPSSTRFIGFSPDVPTDKTIAEFPYYSFLVSDLHAHVVNTLHIVLIVALLAVLIDGLVVRGEAATQRLGGASIKDACLTFWRTRLGRPEVGLIAVFLAACAMGNYWDFAIYYVVMVLVVAVAEVRLGASRGSAGVAIFGLEVVGVLAAFVAVSQPAVMVAALLAIAALATVSLGWRDTAWTRAGALQAWIFAGAHLIALPFNVGFDPISKDLRFVAIRTPAWQLFVMWGPVVIAVVLMAIWGLLGGFRVPVDRPSGGRAGGVRPVRLRHLTAPDALAAVVLPIAGIGLIWAPEVFYVRDVYEATSSRANTMFKFTYQGFILLGIAASYGIVRVSRAVFMKGLGRRRVVRSVVAIVSASLLATTLQYPIVATFQWVPAEGAYLGLDGSSWRKTRTETTTQVNGDNQTYDPREDAELITWINAHVQGQPVVLEATGVSYSHFARISAYTGLPTVVGWEVHEWLWRSTKSSPTPLDTVVRPRQADVETIYTTQDSDLAQQLLAKYHVKYIVVGQLERLRYPSLDADALSTLGQVVYKSGDSRIILVG